MRTRTLARLLKSHKDTRKVFRGVYPCDKIPKSLPATSAIVANTDPHGESGQHWVAYFFTPKQVLYFDSFGLPPLTRELKLPMKMRRMPKYFGRRLQGQSRACGHYCLYFILAMIKGWKFTQFTNQLRQNDIRVRKLVARHYIRN